MKRLTALIVFLSILLCGCSSMFQGEYTVVKPHNEQYEADENADVLTVENFAGLKSAILSFVEAGMEYGVIRANNYDGDVTEDVVSAAYEVARNDPLGAFAIDYMTQDYTRIVSYYELHIYITYRRTMEDISSIVRVSGDADQREKVSAALDSLATSAIFRYSYYSDTDFEKLIDDICSENPMLEFGDPTVTVSLYPESGVQRIVELTINYNDDVDKLKSMKQRLESAVESGADSVQIDADDGLKAYRMYKKLVNNIKLDTLMMDAINDGSVGETGQSATAYGALVDKLSVPEGCAKAYYLLCQAVGIDCQMVYGRRDGYDHVWNIIKLGDDYYHVDTAAAIMEDGFQGFLLNDEAMTGYRWSVEAYPQCAGHESYYTVVPGAAEAYYRQTAPTEPAAPVSSLPEY